MSKRKSLTTHPLSTDMHERIHQMLQLTWDIIASDVDQVSAELGETTTLDVAAEAVADADRYRSMGGDDEAAAAFSEYDWDSMMTIARSALEGSV